MASTAVPSAVRVRSSRRRRACSGSTVLATTRPPPSRTPASSEVTRAMPEVVLTSIMPKSSRSCCELSDPTTSPIARNASRTSRRKMFMAEAPCAGTPKVSRPGPVRRGGSGVLRLGRRRDHVADLLAQFLAGLEMRHVLARKGHGLAGLRVAADARRTVMQREAAEAPDLDALAGSQRTGHHFQQRLDGEVDVLGLQVRLAAGQDLDQFGLGHLGLRKRADTPRRPGITGSPRGLTHFRYYSDL